MKPETIVRRWMALKEATMSGIGGTGGGSQPGLTNATYPVPFPSLLRRTSPNRIWLGPPRRRKKRKRK